MLKFHNDSTKADSCETRVVVVGGGAAGIELSMAMRARWECINGSDNSTTKHKLSITLLDSNDELMPGESTACREALKNVMGKYRIEVLHSVLVNKVTSTHVHVAPSKESGNIKQQNKEVLYTHCIWAAGAEGKSKLFLIICTRQTLSLTVMLKTN